MTFDHTDDTSGLASCIPVQGERELDRMMNIFGRLARGEAKLSGIAEQLIAHRLAPYYYQIVGHFVPQKYGTADKRLAYLIYYSNVTSDESESGSAAVRRVPYVPYHKNFNPNSDENSQQHLAHYPCEPAVIGDFITAEKERVQEFVQGCPSFASFLEEEASVSDPANVEKHARSPEILKAFITHHLSSQVADNPCIPANLSEALAVDVHLPCKRFGETISSTILPLVGSASDTEVRRLDLYRWWRSAQASDLARQRLFVDGNADANRDALAKALPYLALPDSGSPCPCSVPPSDLPQINFKFAPLPVPRASGLKSAPTATFGGISLPSVPFDSLRALAIRLFLDPHPELCEKAQQGEVIKLKELAEHMPSAPSADWLASCPSLPFFLAAAVFDATYGDLLQYVAPYFMVAATEIHVDTVQRSHTLADLTLLMARQVPDIWRDAGQHALVQNDSLETPMQRCVAVLIRKNGYGNLTVISQGTRDRGSGPSRIERACAARPSDGDGAECTFDRLDCAVRAAFVPLRSMERQAYGEVKSALTATNQAYLSHSHELRYLTAAIDKGTADDVLDLVRRFLDTKFTAHPDKLDADSMPQEYRSFERVPLDVGLLIAASYAWRLQTVAEMAKGEGARSIRSSEAWKEKEKDIEETVTSYVDVTGVPSPKLLLPQIVERESVFYFFGALVGALRNIWKNGNRSERITCSVRLDEDLLVFHNTALESPDERSERRLRVGRTDDVLFHHVERYYPEHELMHRKRRNRSWTVFHGWEDKRELRYRTLVPLPAALAEEIRR